MGKRLTGKKKKAPQPEDDNSEGIEQELPIIKKKQLEVVAQVSTPVQHRGTEHTNQVRCPIEQIKVDQILQDILYESSKESQFSRTLKSVLSNGQRELKDKMKHYQFKWQSLGHANISRQEYQRQEQLLKEQQQRDITEIQNAVINQLGSKGVPGFQQKEDLLNEFRTNFMKKRHLNPDMAVIEEFQFYVDPEEAAKLKKSQIVLLEKLLAEQHLVSDSMLELRRYQSVSEGVLFGGSKYLARSQSHQVQTQTEIVGDNQPRLQLAGLLNVDRLIRERLPGGVGRKVEG